MKLTILWEDQRGTVGKQFGPDVLLKACLRDRGVEPGDVVALPKKGNGNVVAALKGEYAPLAKSGPVFAVLDSDKVTKLWSNPPSTTCKADWADRIVRDCQAAQAGHQLTDRRQLVFLVDNVESLVAPCLTALGEPPLAAKPSPNDRDRVLSKVAWADAHVRKDVLKACDSFERLVELVAAKLSKQTAS